MARSAQPTSLPSLHACWYESNACLKSFFFSDSTPARSSCSCARAFCSAAGSTGAAAGADDIGAADGAALAGGPIRDGGFLEDEPELATAMTLITSAPAAPILNSLPKLEGAVAVGSG